MDAHESDIIAGVVSSMVARQSSSLVNRLSLCKPSPMFSHISLSFRSLEIDAPLPLYFVVCFAVVSDQGECGTCKRIFGRSLISVRLMAIFWASLRSWNMFLTWGYFLVALLIVLEAALLRFRFNAALAVSIFCWVCLVRLSILSWLEC